MTAARTLDVECTQRLAWLSDLYWCPVPGVSLTRMSAPYPSCATGCTSSASTLVYIRTSSYYKGQYSSPGLAGAGRGSLARERGSSSRACMYIISLVGR